jgi:hypothetical protein
VDQPQTFRSPTAVVVWVVWLLFAVGNWIDLAVQGRDHASVVAAAVLLLATGVAYVTAQRPRVIVDDVGLTIKNPVRDHRISWAAVTGADLMDLLRVHCRADQGTAGQGAAGQGAAGRGAAGRGAAGQGAADQGLGERRKTISAWAVHYSRRRQYSADVKARHAAARNAGGGRPSLFGGLPAASRSMSYGAPAAASRDSSTEADAKIVVRLINERATATRAEALWAASTPATAATPADAVTPASTATPASSATPASTATDMPATDSPRLLTSTWSTTAIAALVIPALILLVVILL